MSAIHPDETTLLRSILGELPDGRQAAVRKHLALCRPCRDQRAATKRLHRRLKDAGEALVFQVGDPFQARPVPREAETPGPVSLKAMADALVRVGNEKQKLRAAIEAEAARAAAILDLENAACRLAAGHILEEAVESDPSEAFADFASAVLRRDVGRAGDAEAVLPAAQLEAAARLVTGNWHLFCGRPKEAAPNFSAAWTALAGFGAPEHLVAWAEVGESLRRSYLGRPLEGRLLAERALETFERYGLNRGVLRARHARAVALYTAGKFPEAHCEFRAVIDLVDATRLDGARAVSGAAFCLAARGRFHEAASEYSRLRSGLRGKAAQIEQYLLQGEMKVALGTAGRWHQRVESLTTFALPEAGGALRAREVAVQMIRLVEQRGLEAATIHFAKAEGGSVRAYVLLHAAQLGAQKTASSPAAYGALARTLITAARCMSFLKGSHPEPPIGREQILGEFRILASSALNVLGRCLESREAARQARTHFVAANQDMFSLAVADYVEGSAASFQGDFQSARILLQRARSGFRAFEQSQWVGRADAALGTLLQNQNQNAASIRFFEDAARNLHKDRDGIPLTITLANWASSLLMLGRLEAAKTAYARALAFARKNDLRVCVYGVRYGLASVHLKKGEVARALQLFQRIASDARSEGLDQRVLSAELRAAECLGRLGDQVEMLRRIRALRHGVPGISIEFDPPIRELFEEADAADVTSEWVAHVVEHLEARDRGVQRPYRPFKLVSGGG